MVLCDDAVITHELTVKFREDGSFQYLGNVVLNDGIENIPDYQYRIYAEDILDDATANIHKKTYNMDEYGLAEEKQKDFFNSE